MNLSRTIKVAALNVTLLMLVGGNCVRADAIYTYTGNFFPQRLVEAPYTTSDYVSATFTFQNALPSNLPFSTVFIQPYINNPYPSYDGMLTSFSITDQHQTFTNIDATLDFVIVSTDSAGAIVEWYFAATGGNRGLIASRNYFGESDDTVAMGANGNALTSANTIADPGIWKRPNSSSPVPEPSERALVLVGSLAIAVISKARRQKTTK